MKNWQIKVPQVNEDFDINFETAQGILKMGSECWRPCMLGACVVCSRTKPIRVKLCTELYQRLFEKDSHHFSMPEPYMVFHKLRPLISYKPNVLFK